MRELRPGDRALSLDERRNPRQKLNVLVFPYTKILRTDASFRNHGISLGKYHSGSAHCAATEVDQVPIVGEAVSARILAHRRNNNAIRNAEITQREWFEQVWHKCQMNGN